jgi:diacylglycerol kinase family enzyme
MSARPRALVVVNRAACGGRGEQRFASVRPAVEARLEVARYVPLDPAGAWRDAVARALGEGIRVFIAAGGDGTVGAVADALVAQHADVPLATLVLGAIGLGSSNDFHKPHAVGASGVPLRIDPGSAAPRDLGRVRYTDADHREHARVFVVSASLGATAAANALFNARGAFMRVLSRGFLDAAVLMTAVRALARHRALGASLRLGDGALARVRLDNLSVLKTPHLSGGLTYDTPVAPASGQFAVNLCRDMTRLRLARTLAGLARGRFVGRPGTRSSNESTLAVLLDGVAPLELDGEIVWARAARFELLPERILTCTA